MLKLYLSHYRNNPTFAVSFVMTVHDRKINLKNKAIHEKSQLVITILLIPIKSISAKKKAEKSDREIWCDIMYRMAAPVLSNMSEGLLKQNMLVELSPTWDGRNKNVTYMECIGRLMAGLAPWLSLPDDDTPEGVRRRQLREWALKSYANAVDPDSNDYLLWRQENQTLVDAAFIAESFLRNYDALWMPLDSITKQRYIAEFTDLRRVDPSYSNWLLFSATVESFLRKAGASSDTYRISSSLRKIEEWYIGDGWYSVLISLSTITTVLSYILCI